MTTTRPTLDLNTVPLRAAATMLRRISEPLIDGLARGERPAPLSQIITWPEAQLLLAYAQRQNAIPLRWGVLRLWLWQTGWQISQRWRRDWQPPDLTQHLSHAARRSLQHGVSVPRWELIAAHWLDRRVGGVSARWLAQPFWTLAGTLAWSDAHTQAETARTLLATLQRRVLFEPDAPSLPLLVPQTCWTLIALAEIGRPSRWHLPLRRRRTVAALRRLQHIATLHALAPGWAGLWDQWVLLEALRLWPGALDRCTAQLRTALLALPLREQLGLPPVTPSAALPPVALAAAGWEQHIPSWLATLARWEREPVPDAA